jgi:hypothetical protein
MKFEINPTFILEDIFFTKAYFDDFDQFVPYVTWLWYEPSLMDQIMTDIFVY